MQSKWGPARAPSSPSLCRRLCERLASPFCSQGGMAPLARCVLLVPAHCALPHAHASRSHLVARPTGLTLTVLSGRVCDVPLWQVEATAAARFGRNVKAPHKYTTGTSRRGPRASSWSGLTIILLEDGSSRPSSTQRRDKLAAKQAKREVKKEKHEKRMREKRAASRRAQPAAQPAAPPRQTTTDEEALLLVCLTGGDIRRSKDQAAWRSQHAARAAGHESRPAQAALCRPFASRACP